MSIKSIEELTKKYEKKAPLSVDKIKKERLIRGEEFKTSLKYIGEELIFENVSKDLRILFFRIGAKDGRSIVPKFDEVFEKDQRKYFNHGVSLIRDFQKWLDGVEDGIKDELGLKKLFLIFNQKGNRKPTKVRNVEMYSTSKMEEVFKLVWRNVNDSHLLGTLGNLWDVLVETKKNQVENILVGTLGYPTKVVLSNINESTLLETSERKKKILRKIDNKRMMSESEYLESRTEEYEKVKEQQDHLRLDSWNAGSWVRKHRKEHTKVDFDFLCEFQKRRVLHEDIPCLFRGKSPLVIGEGGAPHGGIGIVNLVDYKDAEYNIDSLLNSFSEKYDNCELFKGDNYTKLENREEGMKFILRTIMVSFEIAKAQLFNDGNKRLSRSFISLMFWKHLGVAYAPDILSCYLNKPEHSEDYKLGLHKMWAPNPTKELVGDDFKDDAGHREMDLVGIVTNALYSECDKYRKGEKSLKTLINTTTREVKGNSRMSKIQEIDKRFLNLFIHYLIYKPNSPEIAEFRKKISKVTNLKIDDSTLVAIKNTILRTLDEPHLKSMVYDFRLDEDLVKNYIVFLEENVVLKNIWKENMRKLHKGVDKVETIKDVSEEVPVKIKRDKKLVR